MINEKAGTRDIADSELGDDDDDSSQGDEDAEEGVISVSSDEDDEPPPPLPKVAIARSNRGGDPPRRNVRASNGMEIMDRLSTAFDPSVQRARDEERANRSLQTTQYNNLAQQLRDTQARNDNLQSEMLTMQGRLNEADRARDRAEMMQKMTQMTRMGMSPRPDAQHRGRRGRPVKEKTFKKKLIEESFYPNGGGCRIYGTDDSCSAASEWVGRDGRSRSRSLSPAGAAHWSSQANASSPNFASPVRRSAISRHSTHEHQQVPTLSRGWRVQRASPSSPDPHDNIAISPFQSAQRGLNQTPLRRAPGLNLPGEHSDNLQPPPPSQPRRFPPISRRATSPAPVAAREASVQGHALEVTVSPRRGAPLSFVISPTSQPQASTEESDHSLHLTPPVSK